MTKQPALIRLFASTHGYRPIRAGLFIASFVVAANLLATGKAVDLFHQCQEIVRSAVSQDLLRLFQTSIVVEHRSTKVAL